MEYLTVDEELEAVAKVVADIEKTEYQEDDSFLSGTAYLRDHWDSAKYNPLARRDFSTSP